ncbi:MAG: helix-turn-helix domain-containing protein [Actinomycetota bacterium]|nr:helix-turn-helix domain-containing protein [Actinomycetota bacterium]
MPRRVDEFRGLTQPSRLRLLDAVQRVPGRRLTELADEVGLHVNTARDHLQVLESEGLVTSVPIATGHRGRPPVAFHPVQDAASNIEATRRVQRAHLEAEVLRRISPATDHSDRLGDAGNRQFETLCSHLEDAGFEPAPHESGLQIDLQPCPYQGMMAEDGTNVCDVHRTLVVHQLSQVPGPLELDRFEPFAGPDRCSVSLTIAPSSGGADQDPGRVSRSMPATTSANAPTSTSSHSPSA